MNKATVLIVDDEEAARYGMQRALERMGYEIVEAASVAEARHLVEAKKPDLLLLDINLPGETGIEYLRELKKDENSPLVIIITAHGSERTAVEAIKSGAYDYLSKPFEVDELRLVVKNALETVILKRENRDLKERLEISGGFGQLLGESAAMKRIYSYINKVAETDVTVLIRGESGTGKELVAREIHRRSAHRKGDFVAMNCAAVPAELIESELFGHEKGAFTGAAARRKGKFELASGGTIFLDEIGDMSPTTQAKVLRVLEERVVERLGSGEVIPVDVRVISATHKDLESEIEAGRFRQDLYFRLKVVTIELPPLRERKQDIPQLANFFCQHYARAYKLKCREIAPDAMARLLEYGWPGNVRELRNVIERSVVLADGAQLRASDLPAEIKEKSPRLQTPQSLTASNTISVEFTFDFREARRSFERLYIERVLQEAGGNVTRAAASLGMHRQSLQHKLRELGLTKRYSADE